MQINMGKSLMYGGVKRDNEIPNRLSFKVNIH